MSEQIHQIYHVSRCGSTLLTSLLSKVSRSYAEPSWSSSLLIGVDPYKNMKSFYGSVVKFPSMVSCFDTNFPGKKVFLYRPLSQHLCKMKSVDELWIDHRLRKIDYIFKNHNHPLIGWEPKDNLDKITYLWICSVFRMLDHSDVLWIKTNDFLKETENTLNGVCNHFNLPKVNDFSISNINVKKSGFNGKDDPINEILQKEKLEYTFPSYGVIETDMALFDTEISDIVKFIENHFEELREFLY